MLRLLLALCISFTLTAQTQTELAVPGLQTPVEVLRDQYGVNHIYAKNEHDLFFAQGYCAAKDRLFQFEVWRRQATGTVAEILGPREIQRDRGARLFKFRGNLKQEFNHYHPRGEQIITAFTDGINAYIAETDKDPALLPLEFKLLDIKPGYWRPEVVISRHQGLLGNLTIELNIARAVITLGEDKMKDLYNFEPGIPVLSIDPKIKKEKLLESIIEPYEAFRKALTFTPQDLKLSANPNWKEFENLASADTEAWKQFYEREQKSIGSNNWIVSGTRSKSKFPLLANDPHRTITAPSLRYMVHLNAPGWNVVGGGEPTIPGISIGHNEFGAWGLTIFDIDAEDLYVYELNPENPKQYRYQDTWEDMRVIADTIHVKGAPDVYTEHFYTRHGPVTHVDKTNHVAFAVRCGWLEVGSAPYLASLRIDQATSVKSFQEACSSSYIPGENMIWADKKGNIAWQAVGIAPNRKNWSGLVPVPGDGRYEWDGYLSINKLPGVVNPTKGFLATANENNVPENYPNRQAVGWLWADKYRVRRIDEVLSAPKKFSLEDMMALQFDYTSLPARHLVPLLKNLNSSDANTEQARQRLLNWNFHLHKDSISAGIYVAWEKKLSTNMLALLVPEEGKKYVRSLALSKVISWLIKPRAELGGDVGRDQFLIKALQESVTDLTNKLGQDRKQWRYGQPAYHHVHIKHPLSNAVDERTRKKLESGPLPRGGNSYTPGMTTSSDNQISGASFRMAVDTKDWDNCMFTNTPGQSGNPDSPFYKNLFDGWANDKHFPVYFSRKKVEQSTVERTVMK
jgi:penicillin amidase